MDNKTLSLATKDVMAKSFDKLESKINDIKLEIMESRTEILRWMLTSSIAQVLMTIALMKLWFDK